MVPFAPLEIGAIAMDRLIEQMREHGTNVLLGAILGGLFAWIVGLRKRRLERLSILRGDARDTVVIQHHLITAAEVPSDGGKRKAPATLRIRPLGQSELSRV